MKSSIYLGRTWLQYRDIAYEINLTTFFHPYIAIVLQLIEIMRPLSYK